jgi:hypothetical protein
LKRSLDIADKMPLNNEKVKAERLISPVLMEVALAFSEYCTLYSGTELSVNANDDLAGPCDFFFALHPPKPEMEAPVISLVEAKDEDMDWGIAQCAAQMYAAKLFNEAQQKPIDIIYGCATTGYEWQFLKLENNSITIESRPFTELPKIIGAWHLLIQSFIK